MWPGVVITKYLVIDGFRVYSGIIQRRHVSEYLQIKSKQEQIVEILELVEKKKESA